MRRLSTTGAGAESPSFGGASLSDQGRAANFAGDKTQTPAAMVEHQRAAGVDADDLARALLPSGSRIFAALPWKALRRCHSAMNGAKPSTA